MLLYLFILLFTSLSICSTTSKSKKGFEILQRIDGLAPVFGLDRSERIPDEFIVMFHSNQTHDQHFDFIGKNFRGLSEYKKWSYGYTMNLTDPALRDSVRGDPGVMFVEANRRPHLIDFVHTSPTGFVEATAESGETVGRISRRGFTSNIVFNAEYNLRMISEARKLQTPVEKGGNYKYVHNFCGKGVNVYVFDTGIRITHVAFTNRARNFGNLSPTDTTPYVTGNVVMDDRLGHGTHVAGIIGAKDYGAAPRANLINVKVTNDNGPGRIIRLHCSSDKGRYQGAHHQQGEEAGLRFFLFRGSIINLSLTWPGYSDTVAEAIYYARKAGIQVFAAAGNDNVDASDMYPCSYDGVHCIAGVDEYYKKMPWSNFGSTIDYQAPGNNITSLAIDIDGVDSNIATNEYSGTSMACPQAAGAAAIFTSWLGLINEQLEGNPDYVWYNAFDGLVDELPTGTSDLLINTGIRSSLFDIEPFIGAGSWPQKNHKANLGNIFTPPGAGMLLTTIATSIPHSTFIWLAGESLVTETAVASEGISFSVVSQAAPPPPTVQFSFDPLSSTPTPTATS